ncbi:SH3 domain-containing protein, partial [uncultured Clostridium sp.]|uniref:SH3 domain-containing protein n=1 Tax=uncultured Clostridium sp. TaxID=59620 RepID=UPI00263802C9
MIKNKVAKILISAGVVASVIGVSPAIISHARTFNNEHTYSVDSNNSSIQKAVVNTTVQLSNGTANQYDMVVITGENKNNYNVITQYGVTGSIPKSDLTLVKSGENNQLVKLNETEHVIHVTTVLNVRQQPDVHSGLLTTLKEDTNIQVTGQEGEWFQVNINGQTGFVYDDFVGQGEVSTPVATSATNTMTTSSSQQTSNENTSNSNVVSNTVSSNTITNNQVQATPVKNTNTITSNNMNTNNSQIVNYSTPKNGYVNISKGYLNLRSGAGTSNSVVGHLVKNEKVQVLAKSGNWYKVAVGKVTGWVASNYINLGMINTTPVVNPMKSINHTTTKATASNTNSTTVKPSNSTKPIEHPNDIKPIVKPDVVTGGTTTTTKPEQQKVTKTILEVQTLCGGKQVPNATYCILGTGEYEGQNFNSTNKELVKEFNSGDITGANLTIAPNGYTYGRTTSTVISVKDSVRTIKVIGLLKVDKANEPTHVTPTPVVKPTEPTHSTSKPVAEKITNTVVTAKVMCDGQEINGDGSIFCINSTGEFNGVNLTGGQTQDYPVSTITGGELTTAPTGYNTIIGANKVETTVKGNTRYITIISQVTKPVVKPETKPT